MSYNNKKKKFFGHKNIINKIKNGVIILNKGIENV